MLLRYVWNMKGTQGVQLMHLIRVVSRGIKLRIVNIGLLPLVNLTGQIYGVPSVNLHEFSFRSRYNGPINLTPIFQGGTHE